MAGHGFRSSPLSHLLDFHRCPRSSPSDHGLGARTLLVAPGRTTRNKKLLGAKGIATNGARTLWVFVAFGLFGSFWSGLDSPVLEAAGGSVCTHMGGSQWFPVSHLLHPFCHWIQFDCDSKLWLGCISLAAGIHESRFTVQPALKAGSHLNQL